MLNTHESDSQIDDSGETNSLKGLGFAKVCMEISTRFNIDIKDVIKALQEVYANVMERKKRSGHEFGIQDIKCDVVFRKLESPGGEDVMLVFGPQQLVNLDVVPFMRINPKNGEKTRSAVLRICPGSFIKFSEKYPKTINEKAEDTRKAVAGVEEDSADKEDSELEADGTDG